MSDESAAKVIPHRSMHVFITTDTHIHIDRHLCSYRSLRDNKMDYFTKIGCSVKCVDETYGAHRILLYNVRVRKV